MTDDATEVFPIRFSPGLVHLMSVTGFRRTNSWVRLSPTTLEVRMGWAFSLRAFRSSVRSARPDHDPLYAWGVHGWRGTWILNGSSEGLVRLDLDPPIEQRVGLFPFRVRAVRVAVEDPDALIAALDKTDDG